MSPCAWWVTSRTCATPGRCERTKAAAWRRRTVVTSRRSQQLRATRTSPTSSHSSFGRWWSTWSTVPTGDATVAPSPWPNLSTMCLARGGNLCDDARKVSSMYWEVAFITDPCWRERAEMLHAGSQTVAHMLTLHIVHVVSKHGWLAGWKAWMVPHTDTWSGARCFGLNAKGTTEALLWQHRNC